MFLNLSFLLIVRRTMARSSGAVVACISWGGRVTHCCNTYASYNSYLTQCARSECILLRTARSNSTHTSGGWKKWHNGKLHNLLSLPHVVRVINSRRMRSVSMYNAWRDKKPLYSFGQKSCRKVTILKTCE
jgi:hypothetical protein